MFATHPFTFQRCCGAACVWLLAGTFWGPWPCAEVSLLGRLRSVNQYQTSAVPPLPLFDGRPVSPEDISVWLRYLYGPLASLATRISVPVRLAMERMEAALLCPLTYRLTSVSVPAAALAAASLDQACELLHVTFVCPKLFVVEREGGMAMETLPLAPFQRTRRFAIFASGGLIREASSAELKALLLRQVALIKMLHLYIPTGWMAWQAVQPKPPTQASQLRPASLGLQQKKRTEVEGDFSKAARSFTHWAVAQFLEICRVMTGVRILVSKVERMPPILKESVMAIGDRLSPHWMLSDSADVISAYTEGNGPAIDAAIAKSKSIAIRWKLPEMRRCFLMADEAHLIPNDPIEPVKMWKDLQMCYKIGFHRISRGLEFIVHARRSLLAMRNPLKLIRKPPPAPRIQIPTPRDLILVYMAARRQAELLADKIAAKAMASDSRVETAIESVLAGLIRVEGTPADLRRLRRGDLKGLIDDARIEMAGRYRWGIWVESSLNGRHKPSLQLRIAELAEWAERQ